MIRAWNDGSLSRHAWLQRRCFDDSQRKRIAESKVEVLPSIF
jgi:hypothetical protein